MRWDERQRERCLLRRGEHDDVRLGISAAADDRDEQQETMEM
jgi:hypothetical protein